MTTLNYLLLAAADPQRSGALYSRLLGLEPVESSPGFVMFVLPSGLRIGLWLKDEMEPRTGAADGIDISFSEPDRARVDETYAGWTALGLATLQAPTDMDFGYTFTLADPDGHRLRVFTLHENPR
jgi:catechol 2,3-dioxygenase-like lactoylglutathione lyase family enzyme